MHRDEDLAMLVGIVGRRLFDAERPILERHDLSMWGYAVLGQLARGNAATQLSLAQSIGYDKTRLIALLDDLQKHGLIERRPDADDRRRRTVTLTADGRRRQKAAQRDIRRMEQRLLAELAPAERETLISALRQLAP